MLPTEGSLVALDTETKGTDPTRPEFVCVGIGLASDNGCVYIDISDADSDIIDLIMQRIRTYKLIGHNVAFDGAVMKQVCGEWLDWQWCTYGLYKQIATESYPQQRWGLKYAMTQLLGWSDTNERGIDTWLIENGYINKSSKKPMKGEMWRVPPEILGQYCALDAEATWLLFHLFDRQVLSRAEFEVFSVYHQDMFMPNVKLIVEQQFRGIHIDTPKLEAHKADIESKMVDLEKEFRATEVAIPFINTFESNLYTTYKTDTPKGKLDTEHKRFRFNINSKEQLAWLFFDCLGYEPTRLTSTGRRAIDKHALPSFGPLGKLLVRYNKLTKELGYVKGVLKVTQNDTLHPQFRVPGTVSQRLAGGTPDVS